VSRGKPRGVTAAWRAKRRAVNRTRRDKRVGVRRNAKSTKDSRRRCAVGRHENVYEGTYYSDRDGGDWDEGTTKTRWWSLDKSNRSPWAWTIKSYPIQSDTSLRVQVTASAAGPSLSLCRSFRIPRFLNKYVITRSRPPTDGLINCRSSSRRGGIGNST